MVLPPLISHVFFLKSFSNIHHISFEDLYFISSIGTPENCNGYFAAFKILLL